MIEGGLSSKIHELVRSCSRGEERSSRNAKPCTYILHSQQVGVVLIDSKRIVQLAAIIERKNLSTFECENILSCETHFKYSATENETQFTDGILGEHDYQCCNPQEAAIGLHNRLVWSEALHSEQFQLCNAIPILSPFFLYHHYIPHC